MLSDLFGTDISEPDYGVNDAPVDGTKITQVILYFDEVEAVLLKKLAKEVMKAEMPEDYIEKGNLSALYLLLLKKHPACSGGA
jgi:hypothetical protein